MAKKTKLQESYERIIQESRVSVIGNIPAAIAKLQALVDAVVTTANQTDALFSEFTNEVFYQPQRLRLPRTNLRPGSNIWYKIVPKNLGLLL